MLRSSDQKTRQDRAGVSEDATLQKTLDLCKHSKHLRCQSLAITSLQQNLVAFKVFVILCLLGGTLYLDATFWLLNVLKPKRQYFEALKQISSPAP